MTTVTDTLFNTKGHRITSCLRWPLGRLWPPFSLPSCCALCTYNPPHPSHSTCPRAIHSNGFPHKSLAETKDPVVSFQRFPSTCFWPYAELPWLKRKSSRTRLSIWSQPTSMVLASTGDGQTPGVCATQESRGRFKPRTCDVPCPEHLAHLKEATLGFLESYPFARGRSLCRRPPPPSLPTISPLPKGKSSS